METPEGKLDPGRKLGSSRIDHRPAGRTAVAELNREPPGSRFELLRFFSASSQQGVHCLMDIQISPMGRATLVKIRGRIVDGEPAEKLHHAFRELVREGKAHTIVDLSEVDWFDSTAIGCLLAHYVAVTDLGGKIVILKASDKAKHLMKLVRLVDRFGWSEDLDDALAQLRVH